MKYEIKSENFEPRDVFECGQCFRWNKELNGSYTGVFYNSVLNVEKQDEKIIFTGNCDSIEALEKYFDLNRDYKTIINKLEIIDDNLKNSILYGKGIRILNQDLWECIISFIISANNNIPRIKKIIEKLSQNYGNKIEWNNKYYFSFPTPEQLSKASVEDLKNMRIRF